MSSLDSLISNYIDQGKGHYLENTIEYALREFRRGMDYYFDYVDRLALAGSMVLDAGCGVGNWSIALTEKFRSVYALEYTFDRLNFSAKLFNHVKQPIKVLAGSIEELPFFDATFDCIFCNGVIFLTDYRIALKELVRVLKPGGMLYVSYDSFEWWKFLINIRGIKEAHLIPMACEMLLNYVADTYTLIQNRELPNLEVKVIKKFPLNELNFFNVIKAIKSFAGVFKYSKPLARNMYFFESNELSSEYESLRSKFSTEAMNYIFSYGTADQCERLSQLVFCLIKKKTYINFKKSKGSSIEIFDMAYELKKNKMEILGSAFEGGLRLNLSARAISPVYDISEGVKETLAMKPICMNEIGVDSAKLKTAALFYARQITTSMRANTVPDDDVSIKLNEYYEKISARYPINLAKIARNFEQLSKNESFVFYEVYKFIQSSIFHHPIFQLMKSAAEITNDPRIILLSGIGRCGAVANVAEKLYQSLGYQAKITRLHRHVCCEVKFGNTWRLVDADFFKAGIFPYNKDGQWASLDEIRENPIIIDSFPTIGLQLSPKAKWSRNFFDEVVGGYTDVGLSWDRPYASCYYFDRDEKYYPQKPLLFHTELSNKAIIFILDFVPKTVRKVDVYVSCQSRGWSYQDFPDENYLKKPGREMFFFELVEPKIGDHFAIDMTPKISMYINCYVYGQYEVDHPNVFVWPDEEYVYSF